MELLTIDQIISIIEEAIQGLDPEIREGIVLSHTELPVSELDRLKKQLQIQDLDPIFRKYILCLLYTSPSPRDSTSSRMPSSA